MVCAVQKVDEEPGVVKDSSAQCMLDIIQSSKEKAAKEKAQKEKAGKDPIDPKASEEAPKSGAAKVSPCPTAKVSPCRLRHGP